MYRYKIESADCKYGIRYGTLQAEAAACSSSTSGVYFVSNCDICFLNLPAFDASQLWPTERESPIQMVSASLVGTFSRPIQSVCSGFSSSLQKFLVCAVDNCGTVKVFEETTPGKLELLKTFLHSDSVHSTLEESWTQIRLSPSGNMLFSLHGLSSTLNVVSLADDNQTVIFAQGHPRCACWRDECTIVVGEGKQLSQYYISNNRDITAFNHVSIGSNPISCVCNFSNGDICACTESDSGVFSLNSRNLKIVKRWRAPIRSTILGAVSDTIKDEESGGNIMGMYLCGDDNEILFYNGSGREESDAALRERHTINLRSRSRTIGICLQKNVLYVLGENGDLDAIVDPFTFINERRKRKMNKSGNEEEKRLMMDD